MKYFIMVLFIFIVLAILRGTILLLWHWRKSGEPFSFWTYFFLLVGLVCTAFFLILGICSFVQGEAYYATIIFIALSLLGCSLIMVCCKPGLDYDSEGFSFGSIWGFRIKRRYEDISGIKQYRNYALLYVGRRRIKLHMVAKEDAQFLKYAKSRYNMLHSGKPIQTMKARKDIFNGNVENPGEFIFVYILISLLCIGMIVGCAILSVPSTPEDLEYASLSFSGYDIHEGSLRLYAENEALYYTIPAYKVILEDSDRFISLIESGGRFDIGYIFHDKANTPYYGIEQVVGEDGKQYLAQETLNAYNRNTSRWLFLIFGGLGVFWFAFVIVSIYIGRHPEKFSPRFIRLFFKDGYVRTHKGRKK